MTVTPGLAPPTLRLDQPSPYIGPDVLIMLDEPKSGDTPKIDERGNILEIEHEDGSISISLDGKPLGTVNDEKDDDDWFRNLVYDVSDNELSRVSEDLLRSISNDLESRHKWIDDRAQGMKLLGLAVEVPNTTAGSSDGAPVEGMSRVRHPLLMEAVLRFQANARSELLPTDGPVKIRNDSGQQNTQNEQLANALEKDFNHYLTVTAKEYYPDTDRMLLTLGFGGTAFKKVHFCPLRNRPVSDTVDADDLIVNNSASDLSSASRKTHRIYMKPSTVRRMQIIGAYRDTDLDDPMPRDEDSAQQERNVIQGVSMGQTLPHDRDREIYECYCELDLEGFEHKRKGKKTGLEIPYRVAIDVSSREILSIVRNYDMETQELPEERPVFVKYSFAPGFGFYDIGLLHILANTTNALTAAWRLALDAAMFASFPGFLFSDAGGRQNTNVFRVPPGGGALVKTGGRPLSESIMPLPYKDPSPQLVNLAASMADTGMRIGGTSEQQVGEGKADAPVGTTLAMIDQATKVMNAVHKRLHTAQAEEFQLLAQCFRENPESFWQRNRRPANQWDEATFLQALDNTSLVPQADPNTASHGQRVMKIMGLKQLQSASPNLYDPIAIDTAALQTLGWNNPEQFFVPPEAMGKTPPEEQAKMAQLANETKQADSIAQLNQARAAEIMSKLQQGSQGRTTADEAKMLVAKGRMMDSETRRQEMSSKMDLAQLDARQKEAERRIKEHLTLLGLRKDHLSDMADIEKERIHAMAVMAKNKARSE